AVRVEEEKLGIIRWLRPDYQTLGHADERKQSHREIDFSRMHSKSHAVPESHPGVPDDKSEWPADPSDQVRAVCDAIALLRAGKQAVTPDRIAECFTRCSKKRIKDILCVLETVGLYRL
ncbi:MAG: hypothetical protein FWD57_06180, partial [Polyangiaceae bacterium]|nr:hypothetical protein [Polyangiaceae bacterium]